MQRCLYPGLCLSFTSSIAVLVLLCCCAINYICWPCTSAVQVACYRLCFHCIDCFCLPMIAVYLQCPVHVSLLLQCSAFYYHYSYLLSLLLMLLLAIVAELQLIALKFCFFCWMQILLCTCLCQFCFVCFTFCSYSGCISCQCHHSVDRWKCSTRLLASFTAGIAVLMLHPTHASAMLLYVMIHSVIPTVAEQWWCTWWCSCWLLR